MAKKTDSKDQRIIESTLLSTDEPVFVFRAQDILSTLVLQHYVTLLGTYVPGTQIEVDAVDRLNEFMAWQREHPGKVKLPD